MYSGTSGALAKFVVRVLFRVLGLGFIKETIVKQQSLEAFQRECKNHKLRLSLMCWVIDKLISNAGLALLAGTIPHDLSVEISTAQLQQEHAQLI